MTDAVIVFPILSSVISALCAIVMIRDAVRRPRPDKIAWSIAFVMFALAAGTDAWGRSFGWETWLAKLYYATGVALVVGFLALGELYLLFPHRLGRFAPGVTLFLTTLWMTLVVDAPIDTARLQADGWEAIHRGPALIGMALTINILGTLIIVGGLGYSVWHFWKLRIMRNRMIGCGLIVLGTLSVAAGGSLTRLGHYEYLYIAMSIGVALIFAGVLWTRRRDAVPATAGAPRPVSAPAQVAKAARALPSSAPAVASGTPDGFTSDASDESVRFIEESLANLTDLAIRQRCSEWSAPGSDEPVMTRAEAKQAWALRLRLSSEARHRFDAASVPARRQLATLFHEVLEPQTGEPTHWPANGHAADLAPVAPEPVASAND